MLRVLRFVAGCALLGSLVAASGCDERYTYLDRSPASPQEYREGVAAIHRLYRQQEVTHDQASGALRQLKERYALWQEGYGKPL